MLPLLLLLLFAMVELAYAAGLMQTLKNAAREGARWSAMPAEGTNNLPATTDVQSRVIAYAAAAGITLSASDVTVNQGVDVTEGGLVTSFSEVDVSYTDSFLTPMLAAIVPSLTLTEHAVMRNETN